MRILIAEDEKNIREGLAEFLTDCGYQIYQAEDGQQGLEIFINEKIDLALLDIKMPYMTGIELLKEIRKTSDIPVLFLTAYNDEDYKLQTFSALVDGYIEKPFSLRLVKVRIEALIKKHYKNKDLFQYKNVEVDFVSYKAFLDGKEVDMNAKEFEILHFLFENKDRVLTRDQIFDNVWKDSEDIPYDRVIDAYIYSKMIVSPILDIKDVTNRMMNIDRQAKLKVNSKDEIGDLKNQINILYQRLLGVIDDLDEKNKAMLELEKKKVEFLRATSHELKTPLASLNVILENMRYNIGKYKDRDKYLDESLQIVDKLSKMIIEIISL